MSQPLTKVFATPELFEAILAQFTLQDLLLAQLINHHWHHTITTSPTLQQKLFFEPIPGSDKISPQLNPLLQALFAPFFKPSIGLKSEKFYSHLSDHKDLDNMLWARNEFLTAPNIDNEEWFVDLSLKVAMLRPEASWRRMFPVQPPTQISELHMGSYCCTNQHHSYNTKISSELEKDQEVGVRMGMLFDIVIWGMDNWPESRFFVRWDMFGGQNGAGGMEEAEKNEIFVHFFNLSRHCGGPPTKTGLKIVDDAGKFVEGLGDWRSGRWEY